MPDVEDRYREIHADFDALVAYGFAVSSALAGRTVSHDGQLYADPIFSKLVCHAVTLKRIVPTGITPTTAGATELWDLSSACVVARAMVETYDALAYIAVHEVDDSERCFRILWWKLHDQERRQKMLGLIGSSAPGVTEINENVLRLRSELKAHPLFAGADKEFTKKVQGRKTPQFHLSQAELNQHSGVNDDYYKTVIMFLSQYVHTLPFSIDKLTRFRAGEAESLRQMFQPIEYATGFLAKGIQGMNAVFGEIVPQPSESTRDVLEKWLGIVGRGVCNVD